MITTRRQILAAGAAFPLVAIRSRPANAAEFSYKYANNSPVTHPLNIRTNEAAARIKEKTSGKLEIQVFPNNQLGSDTDMLSQLRSGALEFFTLSGPDPVDPGAGRLDQRRGLRLQGLRPGVAGDGRRAGRPGARRDRQARPLCLRARCTTTAIARSPAPPSRSRRRTISTASRSACPPAPLWTSLFKAFGASPTSINFSEVYTALQTHVVDGQENPLSLIDTAKLYEVQKYFAITNHMWDGFWFLANRRAWEALPAATCAEIVEREFNAAAIAERDDLAKMNDTVAEHAEGQGHAVRRRPTPRPSAPG